MTVLPRDSPYSFTTSLRLSWMLLSYLKPAEKPMKLVVHTSTQDWRSTKFCTTSSEDLPSWSISTTIGLRKLPPQLVTGNTSAWRLWSKIESIWWSLRELNLSRICMSVLSLSPKESSRLSTILREDSQDLEILTKDDFPHIIYWRENSFFFCIPLQLFLKK